MSLIRFPKAIKLKEIYQNSIKNPHNINVFLVLISILLYAVGNFIIRSLIGKIHGPSELGIYSLIFLIYTLGFNFASFGIGVTLTKYISENIDNEDEIKKLVTLGECAAILTGILSGLVLYGISEPLAKYIFQDSSLVYLIKWIALFYPFIAILQTNLGILNGLLKIKRFAILYSSLSLLTTVSTILVVFFSSNLHKGYTFTLIGATIFCSLLSILLISKYFINPTKLHINDKRKYISFAAFVFAINLFSFLNSQINNFIIGYYMTTADIGLYSAALIIVQSLLLFPSAIQRITTPTISNNYSKNNFKKIQRYIRKIFLYEGLIYIFFAIIIAISGKLVLRLLFSHEFIDAYFPLLIMIFSSIIFSLLVSVGGALSAIEKIKIAFIINAIIIVVNIGTSILLVKYLKIYGAAISISVFYMLSVLLNLIFMRKYSIL